ncbi:MAG: Grx4 family monothiol glutaredoxin [Deltaproteobacteria bacterium]|nr:Grx4 family monothiol glutaredoxin [Deltaproteobacteria bacterium]
MADLDPSLRQRIDDLVRSDRVVLFMKGSRAQPRCGFSAAVVALLDGYIPSYATFDVLADLALREGIKAYSEWPTIPQLYVAGEFVGGADIAKEMHASGELARLLGVEGPAPSTAAPSVTITPAAAAALNEARKGEEASHRFLRVTVNARFQHGLSFGPGLAGDVGTVSAGIDIRLDAASAGRAQGLVIDYVAGPPAGFRIDNPQAPPTVKPVSVKELAARLEMAHASGHVQLLLDVRTPTEFATAHIPGARLVDDAVRAMLEQLPRDTPLTFVCHHGGRSQAAADHWLQRGFTHVNNVVGGTDAWSVEVDPTVPRY